MGTAAKHGGASAFRSHPHLYEINTWVWLEHLSQRLERNVTLGSVPDTEWDELQRLGFDLIWLMGVWERSPEARRIFQTDTALFSQYNQALPGWKWSQIVGSPYAVKTYHPDLQIGTWAEIDLVREKLHKRKMGLILDFVPNHTALDHPWVCTNPEYYVQASQEDFRRDPDAFYLARTHDGDFAAIARAKDPYFPPWKDSAQLNYFSPAMRAALLKEVALIRRHCDGVRCDMAMLVLNDIFFKNWSHLLADHSPPAQEFWTEVFNALRGGLWLGEVYWGMEKHLQEMGFQFTYDKSLYDMLRDNRAQDVRSHLSADFTYLSRMGHFLENHDEARSAAVFGAERLEAVGTLQATLPGLRFYHQGQLEGNRIHIPIALGAAAEEPVDPQINAFYQRVMRLSNEPVYHAGEWKLLDVQPAGDASSDNLIAYRWCLGKLAKLVVVNLSAATAEGRIQLGDEISASERYIFADELHDVEYPRDGEYVSSLGLFVRLDPFGAQWFNISPV
jgi:hypothetical protein